MLKQNNIFNFHKTDDNRFRWESNFMALEYSEPSIQAFNEYEKVKDIEDFMYYYYTVKIFKKVEEYEDDNDKPVIKEGLVSERHTYDFPCIDELKWILEEILKTDPRKNGQVLESKSKKELAP